MDDIYNDLENFNDVNIVEELKNENKELKFKLEEYSGAMHKLQKDFDKLSVEYKNLEKNYSSLLKTARAEIERKTETIKNLNLEKDTLVLNSLQKGKNILHNKRNSFKDAQQNKKSTEDANSCLKEVKKIIKKSTECSDNQLHVNRQPSVDTVSSIPIDCQSAHSENKISKTGFENRIPKEECVRGRDGRDKAFIKDNLQERPSVRNVMNRRKSIPSFGDCEPTFSSDEDSRKTNGESQQRDVTLVGEDVRHMEKHYEQQDYVMPESFDYYQPPPSSYRNRGNRYNDLERQKNYECYDKSRRYFNQDNHYRYGKEFSENYNHRDYRDNKRRNERSPPSDRYIRSKSRDRRHKFVRENYRDSGRHSYHNSNHLPAKNKSKFELEEPSSKRPKIDSYSRHSTEHNFNNEQERGLSEKHTKLQDPSELLSCQSPDYINNDSNVLHHPVKEIKHTASAPLPDPRLLSHKYILKTNSEKPVLTTVVGGNVDMIPITNLTWVEDKQKTLGKSKHKELDLVSEKYMDIENFEKSPSLESGEIQSLDEEHYATNYSNVADETEDNVKSSVHRSHQNISHFSAPKEVEKPFMNKYKIPHLKRQNVIKESSTSQEQQDLSKKKLHSFVKDFKVIVEGKHLSEKCPENYSNNIANENPIDNEKPVSILQKLMNEKKLSENANSPKYRKSDKIVNISTIEGDLELSDETSDNMDLLKEDTSQNVMKDKKADHTCTSTEKLKNRVKKSDDNVKKSKDSKKSSHSKKEHVKEKTRDSPKKRKNKKQTDHEELNAVKEKPSPPTKRSKEKENKLSSSNQRKNKFTDLFGDSNSLITPDDLGLTNVIPEKCVSVFENTEDAIDLSLEDIAMVKARKSADNTNIDEKSYQQISDDTVANSGNLSSHENEIHKSNKSIIYENTISETDTSNIVKTVIISTGIQPQHISKDIDDIFPSNINEESDLKKSALNMIKGIATSTPYKLIDPKESQITMNSTTITNASISTKENVINTDLSTNNVGNLKTNTSENKYESDIPDVRIFVRRRKKATKKPT